MKKLISMLFILVGMISAPAFSAETNSGIVRVAEIKADWNNPAHYFYTFNGSLAGNCGKPGYIWSGSSAENINKLLSQAYAQGLNIKVGIENVSCNITTVYVTKQ
ncbi:MULTISPECIES: hypothetical protein [Photorhabdus]|uniref:Uncharacterized protein n=2 Tax=Photorhabdus TaxID=29487 RepID=A0ABX0B1K9_9GAMM|nr:MULTISPECIES: hypothetical protein [Photorhabdus]MCC8374955.1 hypothetical protein [Photorhabdus bodei]MCC8466835.1 hypothetical protein [Photorhabdus bodei]MCT8351424.1 hypothetical protein [Photorhabdus kayaii]MDB6368715.1 hypothetical protein [Photorhabdus bodei]MDB6371182.1 hypothetical protein [Photorhabdus bodei]